MGETIKVLVLNGPNLNLLGNREPSLYGRQTLESVIFKLVQQAKELGMELYSCQSNFEGELINELHEAPEHYTFVIFNPGAFTHTSIALRDAIASINIPVIEVHITNIFARESWRNKSTISSVCAGTISGMGTIGYRLALEAGYSHIKAVLRSRARANEETASKPKQAKAAATDTPASPTEDSRHEDKAASVDEPEAKHVAEPRQTAVATKVGTKDKGAAHIAPPAERQADTASSAAAGESVAPQSQDAPHVASGNKRALCLSIEKHPLQQNPSDNAEDVTVAADAHAEAEQVKTKHASARHVVARPVIARPVARPVARPAAKPEDRPATQSAVEHPVMARPVVVRNVAASSQAATEPARSSQTADTSADAHYADTRIKVKPSAVLADDFASGEARLTAMRQALSELADRYEEANQLNDELLSNGVADVVKPVKSSPFISEAEQNESAEKSAKKSSLKNRIGQMLNKGKHSKKHGDTES